MLPVSIEADRGLQTVTVVWDDGHTCAIASEALRWGCPCALCRGEWGQPGRLDGLTELPADELALADIHLVGGYGLTPVWASGHADGIYTWEYLRSLCDRSTEGRDATR
ncbi:MAG TPA: DUF971 domain-containing protein [Chloroflexota bacterium]|nr:DUF971 domain-containing protein [Chloroflexota bacterium]